MSTHDIRTPLNTIIGLSHLCLQTRLDEHQRQYMSKILTAANELLDVCQGLPAQDGEAPGYAPTESPVSAVPPVSQTLSGQPITAPVPEALSSRVLLVEDNEINQEIACELLKVAGVEVDVAANGLEAVEAVLRTPYALIFMDIQMPVMDGLEATRRLRAEGCAVPIIAMTAHATESDTAASLAAGMNAHLTKPLEPEALFAALNRWMPPIRRPLAKTNENSPQSSTPVHLPDAIDGFNLGAGLSAVGNNAALYATLLHKFASRYATVNDDIVACLQENRIDEAVLLAHTIKGIAANLGASALAEAAGLFEKTLINDPSMAAPHLKALVSHLDTAIAAIHHALNRAQAKAAAVAAPFVCTNDSKCLTAQERAQLADEVLKAVEGMETDWTAAYTTTHTALESLRGTDMDEAAQKLLLAVEDFEADKAREQALALCAALQNA